MGEQLLTISRQLSATAATLCVHSRTARGVRRRSARRGVLLMVVLAMLVLFMMIGTAFLMSSSQSRDAAKESAKKDRLGNLATKLLDRAAYTVLRDTNNPASALRYHSLLRDLYGTDGFQAVVYSPTDAAFDPTFPTPISQATRYAGASTVNGPLGPTQGQFVDIYVRSLARGADDPTTSTNEATLASPDLRHVVKLDLNGVGQPQLHSLPLTKGYYNGCLLTITSGPAAGQSTRILDYEYLADIPPADTSVDPPNSSRLFRFRVMAFPRADGQPLQVSQSAARAPEISDLAGATILVNGRPFSGTGVGYNPLAAAGTPRLNTLQVVPLLTTGGAEFVAEEIALTPNSRYLFAGTPAAVGQETIGVLPTASGDPYSQNHDPTEFAYLNTTMATNYGWFPGPGGTNEDYDAADYQNMILALQTVTPRAQGRVVQGDTDTQVTLSATDPALDPAQFLRLDLEDVPLPSLHRPGLINFWFHRMLNSEWLTDAISDENERVKAILDPYGSGTDPMVAAQITALKRKISMRPLREDNPNFNGSNSLSVPQNLPATVAIPGGAGFQIAIPYWEVVGPWDVDNDNDGIADSIWVDLGDAIQVAEDGTRYKPLYAILCIDLDSRLNVNAHGLVDQINTPANNENLSFVQIPATSYVGNGPNLAGTDLTASKPYSTDQLAQGLGFSPAEISLRPLFPAPVDSAGLPVEGNTIEDSNGNGVADINDTPIDDFAAVIAGRTTLDGQGIPGKYGYRSPKLGALPELATPGLNYRADLTKSYDQFPERATEMKLFDYPININFRTAFGTPPDLFGRYALGLGYDGQPVYEVLYDTNAAMANQARPLLADAPVELNLSSPQRRGSWSENFATPADEFNRSLVQNDDAPFATTDLERVLRAFDADAGTLPSRLWDVVDTFDPIKLTQFDPYRVQAVAQSVFGSSGSPEQLAAAQQMAAISRRLVTTDSYSLPVPSMTPPAYLLMDDKPIVQLSLNARPPKSVAEMFEVRIRRELGFPTLHDEYDPDGDHDSDQTPNATDSDYVTDKPARVIRAARISAIINGGMWLDDSNNPHYEPGIVAPELIAGKRLDLNRPFGDGKDNAGDGRDSDSDGFIDATDYNGNGVIDGPDTDGDGVIDEMVETGDPMNRADGVVDDPLECGDPFLDVDGNGKWFNEPYIDLDGDGLYSPPRDQLWGGLGLAESISFDYTNGAGVPIHPEEAKVGSFPPNAVVRNLESQARQLYARHLYCLMLMLVDAGYIAPHDENDPQIKEYLDTTTKGSKIAQNLLASFGADPAAAQKTRQILLRKLTCRMIAQWAVNCVDMRDADAAMTPFEYDEYPWDGWGCPDRNGLNIPLDGDPATNENGDENMAEAQLATANMVSTIDWNSLKNGGPKVTINTVVPGPSSSLRQTRGLVWGAEQPDLLITETLAFHDRRTEDLSKWSELDPNDTQKDDDPDQRLRPKGSVFIEILNPSSPTGQYPAELYSKLVRDPNDKDVVPVGILPSAGIELGRLSTLGVDATSGALTNRIDPATTTTPTVKRSPVWRMIVTEESPWYRNDDLRDDQLDELGTKVHKSKPQPPGRYANTGNSYFEPVDPDFPQFNPQLITNNEPYVERSFYFTTDNSDRFDRGESPVRFGRNSAMLLVKNPDTKLRIPPEISPKSARYFIAGDVRNVKMPGANEDQDVAIAPVKPGRYAVIGTAGAQYKGKEQQTLQGIDNAGAPVPYSAPRFVTTVSRLLATTTSPDNYLVDHLDQVRRIELLPSPYPDMQQVMVAGNGGTPLFPRDPTVVHRDNEVVKLPNGEFHNIFDGNDDNIPDTDLIPPCVAIPVMNMSVSEPLDAYSSLSQKLDTEKTPPTGTQRPPYYWDPLLAYGEGAYTDEQNTSGNGAEQAYDTPFDIAPELVRNGTTRNYRTVHLQRLADPTLPWNPLPTLPDGKPNPQHDPKLPVNLYRTIDTASVDLTTFNGVSQSELKTKQDNVNIPQLLPVGTSTQQFRDTYGFSGRTSTYKHRLSFRSLERGAHLRSNPTANAIDLVPRELWRREPENQFVPDPDFNIPQNNDMLEWHSLTTDQEHRDWLLKRANDNRVRDAQNMLLGDIDAIGTTGLDPAFQNFPDELKPRRAQFDIVMKHSLGFQNEAFGALTTHADVLNRRLPLAADGTPTKDATLPTNAAGLTEGKFSRTVPDNPPNSVTTTNSTFPWLAWNNRPFISAEELLQVPAGSSSQMLRNYSTINSNPQTNSQTPNPYDGRGVDAMNAPLPVAARLQAFLTPFGHLLNMFQTADRPAGVVTDNTGAPVVDADGNWAFAGAPNFFRILDFVQVPSRFVGTDDMLTPGVFNDSPIVSNVLDDITGPLDPRFYFQPPFNKVSRERDPGKVNLNTVTGRRMLDPVNGNPRHWSEVFDGIMQRYPFYNSTSGTWYAGDGNLPPLGGNPARLGHGGPAWRDVVLSRRGYAQLDAAGTPVDKPPTRIPDTFELGLNSYFPTFFSNPFRSSEGGDLVPLPQMLHFGVDVGWLRGHHYNRGGGTVTGSWGAPNTDDNNDGSIDDTREAGFSGDALNRNADNGELLPTFGAPATDPRGIYPLFSESFTAPYVDGERNPYFYYQPMTRLGNLVTNRSNVYAIWITVGYFEVEPAPEFSKVANRFGGNNAAGLALYNRVYPDGYMLGKELGSDSGDIHRHRGFYIVDRSVPVGFKPGEDLNVEQTIRLRRRIE